MKPTIKPLDYEKAIDGTFYAHKARLAQELAAKNQQILSALQTRNNTMNPITTSPKTSLAGGIAAAPLFVIGIVAIFGGDIGGGIGHILAAIGVLFGLLQAQDASKVADVVKQIVPKPQLTISGSTTNSGGVFNITPQAPTE